MNFDNKEIELPASLPLLPVRDIVVFPYMILPLYVGRDASIKAVEEALANNRMIFLASQKEVFEENPAKESIHTVGTVAMIMRMRKLVDGRVKILIQGVAKGRIKNFTKVSPSFHVEVEKISDPVQTGAPIEYEAMIRHSKELIEKNYCSRKIIVPRYFVGSR